MTPCVPTTGLFGRIIKNCESRKKKKIFVSKIWAKKIFRKYRLNATPYQLPIFFFKHTDWLYSLAPSHNNLTYIKKPIDPLIHNVQKLLDTIENLTANAKFLKYVCPFYNITY